jgi:LysM repeat protein
MASAADLRQELLRRTGPEERRQLRNLETLSNSELAAVADLSTPDSLQKEVEDLFGAVPLSLTLRAPTEATPADWLKTRLKAVTGLQWLGELHENVPVPVALSGARSLGERTDTRSEVQVGGQTFALQPFWPNGALPNLAPEGGLSGALVDLGDASWDEIRGKDPRGAIVLMNFKAGRAWNRAFDLGAQAVIVVEDDYVSRALAEQWFANTPLPMPRFYVNRETGAALRTLASQTPEAVVHGGNWIENRIARSSFAWLPPQEPQRLVIRPGELMERIAAQYGVQADDLKKENRLSSDDPAEGARLDIPGRTEIYVVPARDLLQRIAREKGVSEEALLALNPELDVSLPAGTSLIVPPLADPLVISVRLDAVSALPGLPHGASTAANVAAAVRMLESAAAMPQGSRRRGLLVAFLEGDVHGGLASRLLLETHLLTNNRLAPAVIALNEGTDEETLFRRYLETEAWIRGERTDLPEDTAEWLSRDWLKNSLEQYRVQLAEARVARVVSRNENDELTRIQGQIDALVKLRSETLDNKALSYKERVLAYFSRVDAELTGTSDAAAQTRAGLEAQILEVVQEERLLREQSANNRATTTRVMASLYPESRAFSMDKPVIGWRLDLSSGTPNLQIVSGPDYRNSTVVPEKTRRALVERFDRINAFASIQAGWEDEWSFVGNDVSAVFPVQSVNPGPSYNEFWAQLGVAFLTLQPIGDNRILLDTPLDVPASLDYRALSRQLRTSMLILRVSLESAPDGVLGQSIKPSPLGRLTGQTTRFNIRSGIDAKDPVPQTLLHYPAIRSGGKPGAEWGDHNTATFMGNRIAVQRFSRLNGRFTLPIEIQNFGGKLSIHAYLPESRSGLFAFQMDGGQIGTQKQGYSFTLDEGRDSWKNLVLFQLYPLVISTGVEPLTYTEPTSEDALPQIADAVLKGSPRHINMEHPRIHFGEADLSGFLLYMEPGRRATLIDKRQGNVRGLLLGDLNPDDLESLAGQGVPVGPLGNKRNLVLPLAPLEVARSMQEVNERRRRIYEDFGIRDQELFTTIEISRAKLSEAEAHVESLDWRKAIGAARESWGLLAKNYPSMLKLGREAVLSVVILMALLAPTALFLEKLVLGGKHIVARLGGTIAIFVAGTVFLSFFHPAFKIATSPFIVVIAFTMILMAVVVLSLCYGRFEVLVRRARIEGGEAESEEISLGSSLNTAFSLGVSNLKKRPTRTLLTAFTVTVLTFSIVSFVSVRGKDTLFLRPVPLDMRVQGRELPANEIQVPAYEGALFREYSWAGLSSDFISAVETEFGSRFDLARRFHYIEVAGGNNATQEGRNQIEIRRGKRSAIVTALMGFEPQETRFSGLHRAVSHQQWFRGGEGDRPEDRFHMLIPERVASLLDITPESLVDAEGQRLPDEQLPEVVMMNKRWRVIGIVDAEAADRIRDVNGKPPALVDYLRSAITPQMGSGRLETEDEHLHMSFDDLVLLPVSARGDARGIWNSLAVRFPEGFDFAAFRDELARRMDRAMYAHADGNISLLSARKQSSVGGLAKVLVPVILCVLIVSNTMMGTVDERVGEVQMLGAIGLSPSQISFLLLSESTVFSCIGIIFGTFAGLVFSKISGLALFADTLGQLSFNFTSLASTFLAMGTGGIVLIATLVPARRAAALAAPSGMDKWELPPAEAGAAICFRLPFTLTRGNAIGMAAFFRRFLLNHVDSSSADFISKGAGVARAEEKADALRVHSHMWLAPYDLDVAQDLRLDIEPSPADGVYDVTIHLQRSSGTEDAWMRTNYAFLNLVRKQFLLWRNLDTSLRKRYIQEGAAELQRNEAP